MPSQALLDEFARFDDETLTKLITIGESILTPLETELTSADFSTMVDAVFKENGLADRYYPDWTDKSKSDFGRFLVELFAMFSDKDFFYINHYSREGFLAVAERYRSIFHKAQHFQLNPPSNISASGNVQLTFSAGAEEFVPRGSIVLGIQDMPSLVYTNDEFTIPLDTIDSNITIPFRHGKLQREELYFDGYSLVIDVPNIVTGSIKLDITIAGTPSTWVEVDNFVEGTISDKHYMVFYSDEGKAEIHFASGNLGLVPPVNILCSVEFLVGGGYIGDILAGALDRVISNEASRNLVGYTQFDMTGGNEQMGLELLRQTTIGKARHQNRVVTSEDSDFFCSELSFVRKVYTDVFLNYASIYVLPTGGGNITASQKTLVENKIEPQLLLGYNLNVTSPLYVSITMQVDIYLLPTTIRSGAETLANQAIDEFLNPLKKGEFGDGVNRSILASNILQRVTGSQNVVFPVLHRSAVVEDPRDLDFIKREVIDITGSTFTINLIGGQ